ncbi:hypothetical protein Q9189_003934 [Teloschistes chrysophthalmus]
MMQRVLGRVVSDAQQTCHPRQRYLHSLISHQSLTSTRRIVAAASPHLREDRHYQTQPLFRQKRNFSETNIRKAAQQTPSTNDEEDSENFWKVPAHQTDFWDAYVSTRPNYSPRFYKYIYDHHTSHSPSFQVAHDVGCGAGQVTAELATRFNHVVASELNETHLVVAQERLRRDFDEQKVSYRLSKGEDLAQYYPPKSADLIVAAEAMVLMDHHLALQSFAKLLRPGGTLAFWFYGRPTFADKLHAKGQHLIDTIMVRNWATVIQKDSGPRRRAGFRRAAEGMSSWLDYVPLDSSTWTDVHRIKWNTYGTLPFFREEACGFPIKTEYRVGEGEKTETIEDLEWWRNDWDVEQLKDYFRVLFPGFKDAVGEGNEEMESIYDELRKVMGTGEAAFTWPVALVMATRK